MILFLYEPQENIARLEIIKKVEKMGLLNVSRGF
jgi:hypothetical protein